MGSNTSCCNEEKADVPPVEVTAVTHEMTESEEEPATDIALEVLTVKPTAEHVSSASAERSELKFPSEASRLRLESIVNTDHFEVDQEIIRGISLSKSLQWGGRLWRRSPLDMTEQERRLQERQNLWNHSTPADHFDVFLSHTWLTPGRRKVVSLLLQSGWKVALLGWFCGVGLAEILIFSEILPLPFTLEVDMFAFKGTVSFAFWPMLGGFLGVLSGLILSPYIRPLELMERGIYGLGGFLSVSKELRVLWSSPYLSRLWCVFELAAYRSACPEGKITLKPLFVEMGILYLMFGIYFVAFLFWIGIALRLEQEFLEAFMRYVRGPLREELLIQGATHVPFGYYMILSSCTFAASMNTVTALVKAGAPIPCIVFWFLFVLKLTMFLTERFAVPRWPGKLMNYGQSFMLFMLFFVLYSMGFYAADNAYKWSLEASTMWTIFSFACFLMSFIIPRFVFHIDTCLSLNLLSRLGAVAVCIVAATPLSLSIVTTASTSGVPTGRWRSSIGVASMPAKIVGEHWITHHYTHDTETHEAYQCWKDAGWRTWSHDHRHYCCSHHHVACGDPYAHHHEHAAVVTHVTHVVYGHHSHDNYDCSAGVRNWKAGWSDTKKQFCCQKYSLVDPAMPADWPAAIITGIVVAGMLTALVACAVTKKAVTPKESE
eukprot:g14823.t1